MKLQLIIPTYNAERYWDKLYLSIKEQTIKFCVIVIDSSSTDGTVKLAKQAGFTVHSIEKSSFDHGGARNQATKWVDEDCEFIVFMTQDAILASSTAIETLLSPFADPAVVAVCGRQLPHQNAAPFATHARLFNYPNHSITKSQADIPILGIKCAFMSNSFAAYRKSVFDKLGGFPEKTILAEDMHLAARMILLGYKVAYCAEACVYHSHNYSIKQEFQRYFDTGVFQQHESWIQEKFGKASNEGKKFVLSEWRYLAKHAPLLLPKAFIATFAKWLGFKLGYHWQRLPMALCIAFSMHKDYWKTK
ncbi:glycosyltransferase family 2 protein [Rodentibacter haemolyticus]|uniref:Glycosyltransferase family 2 protein n=1 Tax=Rodentibacter haemolyticus TaxID=2778911 RepID=A0ABX6UYJ4_9PAST|nr:glycosyltransferase [Rodentibacter haemolyticus]QPB43157.1 glycosyltransferase family 2 protein [Rodentibacter haemolyticus]